MATEDDEGSWTMKSCETAYILAKAALEDYVIDPGSSIAEVAYRVGPILNDQPYSAFEGSSNWLHDSFTAREWSYYVVEPSVLRKTLLLWTHRRAPLHIT